MAGYCDSVGVKPWALFNSGHVATLGGNALPHLSWPYCRVHVDSFVLFQVRLHLREHVIASLGAILSVMDLVAGRSAYVGVLTGDMPAIRIVLCL